MDKPSPWLVVTVRWWWVQKELEVDKKCEKKDAVDWMDRWMVEGWWAVSKCWAAPKEAK